MRSTGRPEPKSRVETECFRNARLTPEDFMREVKDCTASEVAVERTSMSFRIIYRSAARDEAQRPQSG